MDDPSYLIIFRGLERLLISCSGLTSIVLGYRLFKSIPDFHGSQGKFEALKASVSLSKVGPGVFFAAFGSFVLWRSIDEPMRLPLRVPTAGETYTATASYLGANRVIDNPTDLNSDEHIWADIAILNCLYKVAGSQVEALGPTAVQNTVHNAKVALLIGGWQADWGGDSQKHALTTGNIDQVGQKAADLYRAANPRCLEMK